MARQMTLSLSADTASSRNQVVRLEGRMDALGGTEVWDEVAPRVTAEQPNLILDMTGVAYLSSAGITTLIQLLNKVKPLGGKLAIYGCNPTLRRVFRVVALDPILNVCETLEEARARGGRVVAVHAWQLPSLPGLVPSPPVDRDKIEEGARGVLEGMIGRIAETGRPLHVPDVHAADAGYTHYLVQKKAEDQILAEWAEARKQLEDRAGLDPAGKPNLTLEYEFHRNEGGAEKFFNKTNPQQVNASNLPPQFDPSKFPVPGGITVPLATFAEGEYRLNVKITDKAAGKTLSRDIKFSVKGA